MKRKTYRYRFKFTQASTNRKTGPIVTTMSDKPLRRKTEREAIKRANESGLTINLSADNLKEADELYELGIAPVAVVVPDLDSMPSYTPAGRKIVACPQSRGVKIDGVPLTCGQCTLCAIPTRKSVIAFPAHGSGAKYVKEISQNPDYDQLEREALEKSYY